MCSVSAPTPTLQSPFYCIFRWSSFCNRRWLFSQQEAFCVSVSQTDNLNTKNSSNKAIEYDNHSASFATVGRSCNGSESKKLTGQKQRRFLGISRFPERLLKTTHCYRDYFCGRAQQHLDISWFDSPPCASDFSSCNKNDIWSTLEKVSQPNPNGPHLHRVAHLLHSMKDNKWGNVLVALVSY